MPMFEYVCRDCGERFEELVATGLDGLGVSCPECGSEKVQKLVSRFASTGVSTDGGGGVPCAAGSGRFT